MSNAAAPVITVRQIRTHDGHTAYVADGPCATSAALLARGTPEQALADGTAYFLRTRKWVADHDGGSWEIAHF